MKKLLTLVLALLTLTVGAQTFPSLSPAAKVYQMVGVNGMEIDYSSPAVRDREIFGALVPLGVLWRTGANAATTLTATDAFSIGGKNIAAGTYAIFTIPQEEKITVIFSSKPTSTGDYDKKNDVARVTVPFIESKTQKERMQFTFENTTPDATDLTFHWADKMFVVPITVPTERIVTKNAEAKIASGDVDFGFYNDAANYYLEIGNAEKALKMAKKSTDKEAKFYNVYTLAKAYQAVGDKEGAKKAAQESLKLAQAQKYDHYIMLNKKLLKEL